MRFSAYFQSRIEGSHTTSLRINTKLRDSEYFLITNDHVVVMKQSFILIFFNKFYNLNKNILNVVYFVVLIYILGQQIRAGSWKNHIENESNDGKLNPPNSSKPRFC